MTADALSDLLRTVRLTGATFFNVVGKEPWVVESPARELILPKILRGADHLIAYHVVTEGKCFGSIVGGQPIALAAGEVIVFTNCDPHVMASHPGMRAQQPADADTVAAATADQLPFVVNCGADGMKTNLVCGYLACDARPFNPLLENLPPVITAGNAQDPGAGWLGQFIHYAVAESVQKRAGGESVLARLSELMFIEVLRQYLGALPPEQAGWLAGLRDPFIGKALSLLHGTPGAAWTLVELARQVGMSRSVLAERFMELVGVPPMQYLAKWRIQRACERLSGGNANIAMIAAECGYETEAGFSRAFKKMLGVSPSAWRQRIRHGG